MIGEHGLLEAGKVILVLELVSLDTWHMQRERRQRMMGHGPSSRWYCRAPTRRLNLGKTACATAVQTKGINKQNTEPPIVMKPAVSKRSVLSLCQNSFSAESCLTAEFELNENMKFGVFRK